MRIAFPARLAHTATVLAALAAPTAAFAQADLPPLPVDDRQIGLGQELAGTLTTEDQTLEDGSHAQAWALGANGLTITIDLLSDDFDAYLMLTGPEIDGRISNDDGAGACNARITHTLDLTGSYTIVVNSVRPGETGAFTLRVTGDPEPIAPGPCGGAGTDARDMMAALQAVPIEGPLRIGSEVNAELTDSTPRVIDEGPHALAWEIAGRVGEDVTIDMFSEAFDAFLVLVGPGLDEPLSDDDCGGGTDASLTVAFPMDSVYRVLATTFTPGETGPFTLFVSAATDPERADCRAPGANEEVMAQLNEVPVVGPVARGEEVKGALSADDFAVVDGSYAEAWELAGTAGMSATIDLVSDQFDAFLVVIGPGLDTLLTDDDGAGACNARITVTFPETGTYRVVVSTIIAGMDGSYLLRVTDEPGPVDPAACEG